jgi:hypothetical protein
MGSFYLEFRNCLVFRSIRSIRSICKHTAYLGFPLLTAFLLVSCSPRNPKQDIAAVSGEIKNANGRKVFFAELGINNLHDIDSATLDTRGKFSFAVTPGEPGFYLLTFKDGKLITLLLDKGENVKISADCSELPGNYTVTGSEGSELVRQFHSHSFRNRVKVDSLEDILRKSQYSPNFYRITLSFDTIFKTIRDDQVIFEKAFIDLHPRSLADLLVLNFSFGPKPVLSEEEDFSYYRKVDSALMPAYPGNKHVQYHHMRVLEHERRESVKKLNQPQH